MILEIATFHIKENAIQDFENATKEAITIISKSKGFEGLEFRQCVEATTKFVALIRWKTLEDHTLGFGESQAFQEWRAVLSPYFESSPVAEHFKLVEV